MLKKMILILILALFLLCFSPLGGVAFSLTTPHIIIEGEVWLLNMESGKRIFLLPNTYYAKIDNMDDNFYYVTFNSIRGKVEKSIVSTVGYHTQASGTIQELKVHPQYSDFLTIALKSSMDATAENIIADVNESFIFLGEYPLAEMWYCVKYADKIGYIKASRTTVPEVEIPAFIPDILDDTEPLIDNAPKNNNLLYNPDKLKIIIIIGLSIPAIALIILLFKPQKPKRHRYYYEE